MPLVCLELHRNRRGYATISVPFMLDYTRQYGHFSRAFLAEQVEKSLRPGEGIRGWRMQVLGLLKVWESTCKALVDHHSCLKIVDTSIIINFFV